MNVTFATSIALVATFTLSGCTRDPARERPHTSLPGSVSTEIGAKLDVAKMEVQAQANIRDFLPRGPAHRKPFFVSSTAIWYEFQPLVGWVDGMTMLGMPSEEHFIRTMKTLCETGKEPISCGVAVAFMYHTATVQRRGEKESWRQHRAMSSYIPVACDNGDAESCWSLASDIRPFRNGLRFYEKSCHFGFGYSCSAAASIRAVGDPVTGRFDPLSTPATHALYKLDPNEAQQIEVLLKEGCDYGSEEACKKSLKTLRQGLQSEEDDQNRIARWKAEHPNEHPELTDSGSPRTN